MVNFGEKIKTLRTEYGFTQKQLAELSGVAVSAISSYESGGRYPSYDVLISLSRIFHVSTDYLLGLDKMKTIDVSGLDEQEVNVKTISQVVKGAEVIYHNRSFFTFRGKKAAFDCGYLGCVIKFMCISIGVTVMVYEFIKERRKIYAGFYVL